MVGGVGSRKNLAKALSARSRDCGNMVLNDYQGIKLKNAPVASHATVSGAVGWKLKFYAFRLVACDLDCTSHWQYIETRSPRLWVEKRIVAGLWSTATASAARQRQRQTAVITSGFDAIRHSSSRPWNARTTRSGGEQDAPTSGRSWKTRRAPGSWLHALRDCMQKSSEARANSRCEKCSRLVA